MVSPEVSPAPIHDQSDHPNQTVSHLHNAVPTKRPVRSRLWCTLLLPTLAVVLINGGLAVGLIAWFSVHKSQQSLIQVFKDHAFYVRDNGRVHQSTQVSVALDGLTLTTAASTLIGITTPILLSVYAFRTAQLYMSARSENRPTTVEHGLLLESLGASGIASLKHIAFHFWKNRKTRPFKYMLVEAFVIAFTAFSLAHVVGVVDLWVHATTGSLTLLVNETASQNLTTGSSNYALNLDPNPCVPSLNPGPTCSWDEDTWQDNFSVGMQVASNSSLDLATITLSDADDLAILVPIEVPQDITFEGHARGARATCQSMSCKIVSTSTDGTGSQIPNITCDGFPTTFPPSSTYQFPTVSMQSADCETCTHANPEDLGDNTFDGPSPNTSQAYSLWMQLTWVGSQTSKSFIDYEDPNLPEHNLLLPLDTDSSDGITGGVTMFLNCSLAFYNVSIFYDQGNYSRISEEFMEQNAAATFVRPTRLNAYSYHILSTFEGKVFADQANASLFAYFNQELAQLALSFSAGAPTYEVPVDSQELFSSEIFVAYAFWPLFVMILLLLLYAVFALAISLCVVLSQDGVNPTVTREIENGEFTQSFAELQQQFTSPLALATHFWKSGKEKHHTKSRPHKGSKHEKAARNDSPEKSEDPSGLDDLDNSNDSDSDDLSILDVL